ncbi:MAG: cytochrome c biogenesis protein CcsA [Phycisphaerae bacterium]|nr:cytochrome c biogenesis protein CcsA [Phycisphaerae bacterium]
MLQLPLNERLVLYLVLGVYLVAGTVAARQLSADGPKYRRLLTCLIIAGICLQSILLVLRGMAIQGFPLTGLFESMTLLGIASGAAYLLLSTVIPQVWFQSAMTWILLLISVLGAKVASPVTEVHEAAKTPWALVHGLAMVLSAAAIAFATVSAWMYVLANKRLKNKELGKVLGRMPNIEKLRRMNLFGIEAGFVLLSFGLFTGLGMAAIQIRSGETTLAHWLIDPKIVLILLAWLLLAAILVLRPLVRLGGKAVAYLTMVAFFLIIFAIVGVTFFCGTRHVFSHAAVTLVQATETV